MMSDRAQRSLPSDLLMLRFTTSLVVADQLAAVDVTARQPPLA
jgi:hypothetical protein